MEVEAINTARARVGDRIVLNIQTGSLLKATFLLYVFPILAMIAGAVLGQTVAGMRGSDPSGFPPCSVSCFSGWPSSSFASWVGASPPMPVTNLKSSRSGGTNRCRRTHRACCLKQNGDRMDQTVFISKNNTATFRCPNAAMPKPRM
jgi:hypothetical protein